MIHYSCDRCRRLIETEDELRYVLQVDVQAQFGEEPAARYDESESFAEIDPLLDEEHHSRNRFDLCSECYAAFLKNPLGRETTKSVGFSDN